MKIKKSHKISLTVGLGLLFIILIAVTFKEGLENPEANTIKCYDKGMKCNKDITCCEGLKCLGEECK